MMAISGSRRSMSSSPDWPSWALATSYPSRRKSSSIIAQLSALSSTSTIVLPGDGMLPRIEEGVSGISNASRASGM